VNTAWIAGDQSRLMVLELERRAVGSLGRLRSVQIPRERLQHIADVRSAASNHLKPLMRVCDVPGGYCNEPLSQR
jgi:hypothetical protein